MGWRAKPWMGKDVREMLGFLGMTGRSQAAPWGPLGPPCSSRADGRFYLIVHNSPTHFYEHAFLCPKELGPSRARGTYWDHALQLYRRFQPWSFALPFLPDFGQAASTTREEHKRAAGQAKSPPFRASRLTNPPLWPLPTY